MNLWFEDVTTINQFKGFLAIGPIALGVPSSIVMRKFNENETTFEIKITNIDEIIVFAGAFQALLSDLVDFEKGNTNLPALESGLSTNFPPGSVYFNWGVPQALLAGANFAEFDNPGAYKATMAEHAIIFENVMDFGRPLLTLVELRRVWLRRLAVSVFANQVRWPWSLEYTSDDDLRLMLAFSVSDDTDLAEEPPQLPKYAAYGLYGEGSSQGFWRRTATKFHPYANPAKDQKYHFMWLWDPNPIRNLRAADLAVAVYADIFELPNASAGIPSARDIGVAIVTRFCLDLRIRRGLKETSENSLLFSTLYTNPVSSASQPPYYSPAGPFYGPEGSLFGVINQTYPYAVGSFLGLLRGQDETGVNRVADCKVIAPFVVAILRAMNIPARVGASRICDLDHIGQILFSENFGSPMAASLFSSPWTASSTKWQVETVLDYIEDLKTSPDSQLAVLDKSIRKAIPKATACLHRWVFVSGVRAPGGLALYHAIYINQEHGTSFVHRGSELSLWMTGLDFVNKMFATLFATQGVAATDMVDIYSVTSKLGDFTLTSKAVNAIYLKAAYADIARLRECFVGFCDNQFTLATDSGKWDRAIALFGWAVETAQLVDQLVASGKLVPPGVAAADLISGLLSQGQFSQLVQYSGPEFGLRAKALSDMAILFPFWRVQETVDWKIPSPFMVETYGLTVPVGWEMSTLFPLAFFIHLPLAFPSQDTLFSWELPAIRIASALLYYRVRDFYITQTKVPVLKTIAKGWQ